MSNNITINSYDNAIASVIVYQSNRAFIQRRLRVDLIAGRNEITIERLPSSLDPESIRVEAEGEIDAEIFDLIHTPPQSSDRSQENNPVISELRKQENSLKHKKKTNRQQSDTLLSVASSLTGDLNNSAALPQKMDDFLEYFSKKNDLIYKSDVDTDEKLQELKDKIKAAEKDSFRDDQSLRRRSTVKVIVAVPPGQSGPIDMILSYFVPGASWSSLFDLRVRVIGTTTSAASISLSYRASIQQSTGEDWTNVALTLSTTSPLLGSTIPSLRPLVISQNRTEGRPSGRYHRSRSRSRSRSPRRHPRSPSVRTASGYRSRDWSRSRSRSPTRRASPSRVVALSSDSYDDRRSWRSPTPIHIVAKPVARPVFSREMVSDEGTLNSTFIIPATSTIPSDNSSHKVSITTLNNLPTDLEWVCVPKEVPSAFMRCQVKNASTFVLLPGPCNVYMDGNYSCKSFIPNIAPQESFTCSLGVDPLVRCTYHPQEKVTTTRTAGFISKSIVTTFTQRISLKNLRPSQLHRLILRDQVPLSDDTRFKIVVLEPPEKGLGPPSVFDGAGRALPVSSGAATSSATDQLKTVAVSNGVTARWAPKNEEDGGSGGPAGTGVVEWICEIGTVNSGEKASEKGMKRVASMLSRSSSDTSKGSKGSSNTLDVVLKWEVTAPEGKWRMRKQ